MITPNWWVTDSLQVSGSDEQLEGICIWTPDRDAFKEDVDRAPKRKIGHTQITIRPLCPVQ